MPEPPFVNHCLELPAPLGPVRARRMFGMCGLYVNGLFVALVAAERLYLKADAGTRATFGAAGCEPFTYRGDGRSVTLGYRAAPAEALDSPVPAGSARLSPACSHRSSAAASWRCSVTQTQPPSTRSQRAAAAAGSVRAWHGARAHDQGARTSALG